MSFQIYNWLEKYVHEVVSTFGYRIWFIGVQGSYARGEATEESDIDVVPDSGYASSGRSEDLQRDAQSSSVPGKDLRIYFWPGRAGELV